MTKVRKKRAIQNQILHDWKIRDAIVVELMAAMRE